MKQNTMLAGALIAIVVVAIGAYLLTSTNPVTNLWSPSATSTETGGTGTEPGSNGSGTGVSTTPPSGAVTYYCTQGKFSANFLSNSVAIKLTDGTNFSLSKTSALSGFRYEATTTGNYYLLVGSGDDAALSENHKEIFGSCTIAHDSDALLSPRTFVSPAGIFSFNYPSSMAVVAVAPGPTTSWMVNATTTGQMLAVVQLPANAQPKTNFAGAQVTVGSSVDKVAVATCLTDARPGGAQMTPTTVTINGVTFTKFTSSDAGAGNFYTTISYRLVRSGTCYAVESTIHSTNIDNYPPSAGIHVFNQASVQATLGAIVASFKFLK